MKINVEKLSDGELKETYEYLRLLHRICIILGFAGLLLGVSFNTNLLLFAMLGLPFALVLLATSDNLQKEIQKRRWERYK
tara:strand:- start:23004 stop:23243 length:240 start_codon:yes stop_codon:yes gene_type:complete